MPDKIITQRAQGYGNQPVTITVQIDGATVFNGTVSTLDEPPPALPTFWTPELGVDSWSWTVDPAFQGTQTMTVSIDNGELLICDTFYTLSDYPGKIRHLAFGQDLGNVQVSDPFTAVSINGVLQDLIRDADHAGQWVWQLTGGDQFACTVNILATPTP